MVEMAVVLFLLLLIVVPMAYSIDRSMRVNEEIYRATTAALLAQQKIEEVRTRASCYTTDWVSLGAGDPIWCPDTPPNWPNSFRYAYTENAPACTFPQPFDRFKCQVWYTAPDMDGDGADDALGDFFKELQVHVWYDGDGDNIQDSTEVDVMFQTGITYRPPAWRN